MPRLSPSPQPALSPPFPAGVISSSMAHAPSARPTFSFGLPALDEALQGGLAQGACHEIYAARRLDAPSTCGFALALALRAAGERPLLWVRHEGAQRQSGAFYPSGLHEFGLDPARLTLVMTRDELGALQGGLEGARCTALGATLIELSGQASSYDLTASRRLALAAQASGVCVLLIRLTAQAQPSAAESRWQIKAAPSRRLPPGAPGHPAFFLSLLRYRRGLARGIAGQAWHVEWNRDRICFEDRRLPLSSAKDGGSPLSCPVVSLSSDRTPQGAEGERRAG